ncbi:hypothetical protein SAMN05444394_3874 [Algoriphagus halophilus]|uniref:Uncharacterized protein n=1 Tax=Algoriphagus halophilus TaxID=226505 RepID=A0A1N6HP89_9BACT|nr:hypothetical protein SAMN05444394_3874 [Algoriphagus halophilus]
MLLACFAIYQFGYYAFYFSYENHLEAQWEEDVFEMDMNLDEQKMLEVPLTVPYMSFQEDFQVTNTRFELDGNYYRAIKQRYTQETLQIIYVPDTSRTVLDNTFKQWVSSLIGDDLPQDQQGKSVLKNFVKDYIQACDFSFTAFKQSIIDKTVVSIFSAYKNPFYSLDSPPPQLG